MMPWLLTALMLVALPLVGIVATGRDPAPFLAFPPLTGYVPQAGFSWPWFALFAMVDGLAMAALLWAVRQGVRNSAASPARPVSGNRFPWWGWLALVLGGFFWFMAWTRLTWFRVFQQHTFLPIWIGFIFTINALAVKRSGRCLMLRRPGAFFLLFPASAGFWWVFEYFNRFVQNWYYTGIHGLGPGEYSYLSSIAFATVLPGVLSMIDLLLTFPALNSGLARGRPLALPAFRWIPVSVFVLAAVGLALIGVFPDQLFALLWVSPLLIILSVQAMTGRPTLLSPLRHGDWRPVVTPALAALICGFFWEMWNYFSLARWSYAIAYVQRFHLFEMPILGYGGYLPFGLTCLAVGTAVVDDLFAARSPA
jgi:hypothetical protein